MTKCLFQLLLTLAGLAAAVGAEDFRTTSKITSLVGQVTSQTQAGVPHPAKLNDPFVTGDLLTTGFTSRAELTAPDHTVIRVGSNSVFGFDEQARQMILRQGSVLFHTPHGQGGGVIKTSAVTAAVSGSTVSICTTSGGGAKVVPLESPCTITGQGGRRIATITPGQMLALLPGAKPIVVSIDLGAFVRSSGLIQKFQAPLATEVSQKIEQNVDQQQKHAPEKTQILLVDNVALDPNARPPVETLPNNPLGVSLVPPAQPPPKGSVETIFDPQIVAAFKLSLVLSAKQLPSATDNIFPVINSDPTKSPLAYIQSRIGPPPATGRYSGLPFSDPTLAVFGVTPALPAAFTLPAGAKQVLAHDVILSTVVGLPGTSGQSFDPNAGDLTAYQSNGFFGIATSGDLSFDTPKAANDWAFSIIHAPDTVAFGAGGSFTADDSQNPGYKLVFLAFDTSNLVFGSGGPMILNNVAIYVGNYLPNGNFSAGSLTSLMVQNADFYTNSVSLYSGGPLDLLGTNRFIPPGGSFSARMTAVGDLSVQGDVYVSTSGSSDLTLTSTTGNVVVTGSINVSGPSSNLTIQAAQLASFNPSVVFAPSSGLFNMTGQTVFLDNAHFNSNTLVTLQSADHLPAFFPAANGGSLRRGAVNLGGNVTADGSTLLNGSNAGSYANFQVNP